MACNRSESVAPAALGAQGFPSEDEVVVKKIRDLMEYMIKMSGEDHNFEYQNNTPDLGFALRQAKREYKRRRDREKQFNVVGLFADPAWDILLDLFINRAEGKKVCTSSACIASCVPVTTALRWITALENDGFVYKSNDESDRRRTYIELTEIGLSKMLSYFE